MKYAWIEKHRRTYATTMMCELLSVSRSGLNAAGVRAPSKRANDDEQLVSQDNYFKDLGLSLKCIALADRSGTEIKERGYTSSDLLAVVERKKQGKKLTASKGKKATPRRPSVTSS